MTHTASSSPSQVPSLTEKRLKLHSQGWSILPARGKAAYEHGWNTAKVAAKVTPARIEKWARQYPEAQGTGVRIQGGLCAIDIDVDHPIAEKVLDLIHEIAPAVAERAPMRRGHSAHKVALFVQLVLQEGEVAFNHWGSPKYRIRGQLEDNHHVEIFGGGLNAEGCCSRQFVIDGPHPDGGFYAFADGDTLFDTPLAQLPIVSLRELAQIIERFKALAVGAHWIESVPEKPPGSNRNVYDITEATRFETKVGTLDYEELEAAFVADPSLRCSTSFIPGRDATRDDHCKVIHSNQHDCVAVYVFGDEETHFPAEMAPVDPSMKLEGLYALADTEAWHDILEQPQLRPRPQHDAPMAHKIAWLLDNYAYCDAEHKVIRLRETDSKQCRLTWPAFMMAYAAWFEIEIGPQGGQHKKTAAAAWHVSPRRLDVAGIRMRPDQPFPLYEENGQIFKNTYRRPVHEGTGELTPFLAFIERLIPDPIERAWRLDWMAYKQARPWIPGISPIAVADNTYGTGRGIFASILHKLYGEQYCRTQSFSVLDGSTGQGVFNDWMADCILVTLSEARTSPTAYRKAEQNAVYEILKDIVEPVPVPRTFRVKHGAGFYGTSYCSICIDTNHADAIAIPAEDRRFTVLRNGREISREEVEEIVQWREAPGSIAELSRFLAARDLSSFDMFRPLHTEAKSEMSELSRSPVEEFLRELAEDDALGKAFTRGQLLSRVTDNPEFRGQAFAGHFEAAWRVLCVKVLNGSQHQVRSRIWGSQKKIFCFKTRRAEVARMPEAAIQREVAKWGGAVTQNSGLSEVLGLTEEDE